MNMFLILYECSKEFSKPYTAKFKMAAKMAELKQKNILSSTRLTTIFLFSCRSLESKNTLVQFLSIGYFFSGFQNGCKHGGQNKNMDYSRLVIYLLLLFAIQNQLLSFIDYEVLIFIDTTS